MTSNCKYIDTDDLETFLENGYGEGLNGYDIKKYYEDAITSNDFVDYIDWQNTRLQDLYDDFVQEN